MGEGACEKSGIRQWGGGVLVSAAGRSLAAEACITLKANWAANRIWFQSIVWILKLEWLVEILVASMCFFMSLGPTSGFRR